MKAAAFQAGDRPESLKKIEYSTLISIRLEPIKNKS